MKETRAKKLGAIYLRLLNAIGDVGFITSEREYRQGQPTVRIYKLHAPDEHGEMQWTKTDEPPVLACVKEGYLDAFPDDVLFDHITYLRSFKGAAIVKRKGVIAPAETYPELFDQPDVPAWRMSADDAA